MSVTSKFFEMLTISPASLAMSIIRFSVTEDISLLQLRIFRFRSYEDGDVRVGVFPQCEEIQIGRLGLGGVALHGVGSADLEMRECTNGFVEYNSAMGEDFLELGGGFFALMGG